MQSNKHIRNKVPVKFQVSCKVTLCSWADNFGYFGESCSFNFTVSSQNSATIPCR